MADLTFGAIIPAAGLSIRMEKFKPLAKIDGQTLIQHVISLFKKNGVEKIVTVTGHRGDELIPILERASVRWIANPGYREEMLTSIKAGARKLLSECDAFFVLPVDIPLVRPLTVHRLKERFKDRDVLVCHPSFQSRRGHPPLIDASLTDDLLAWHGEGGLKGFLGHYADHSVDVPVADAWIRRDADTESELNALRRDFRRYTIPAPEECRIILEHYLKVPERVQAHSRAVAKVAVRLGEVFNNTGEGLDLELLQAAGLLHDCFKAVKDHARKGAVWLRENGFPEVAAIVAEHIDLSWTEGDTVEERALLYLADKVVEGERIVTLAERKETAIAKYGLDASVRKNIDKRFNTAAKIQVAVEKITGRSIDSLLKG